MHLRPERYAERFTFFSGISSARLVPLIPQPSPAETLWIAGQWSGTEIQVQNAFSELVAWADSRHWVGDLRCARFVSSLVTKASVTTRPAQFRHRGTSFTDFTVKGNNASLASAFLTRDYTFGWKKVDGNTRDTRPLVELAVMGLRGFGSGGGAVTARIREVLREQWSERNPASTPGHDAMGGTEGEQLDGHLEHEERMALALPDHDAPQYLLIDFNTAESDAPKSEGSIFEVTLLPLRSFDPSTYMARLPAGAFCGWSQLKESNGRTFTDAPDSLVVTRHMDPGTNRPKPSLSWNVTATPTTLSALVTKHIRAVRQRGQSSDQPVVLVYWPHDENSMPLLLRDLVTRSGEAVLFNEGIRVLDLAKAIRWSPFLPTYINVDSLDEMAWVNSHHHEARNESATRAQFMQTLVRLATNPIDPSPSLRHLNEFLDRAGDPVALGRFMGEYLARRILGARTKTIASLKRWPGVVACLLTRYDVKCWFYLALPDNLKDDLLLLTAYAISRGIRDGWATVQGNKQLLALIGTPEYQHWLGDVRSRTPPDTRPGRPGVPYQFRDEDSILDLQAALRNLMWTGTGQYRGPAESTLLPVNKGYTQRTINSKEEIEEMRRWERWEESLRSRTALSVTPHSDAPVADDNVEIIDLSDS